MLCISHSGGMDSKQKGQNPSQLLPNFEKAESDFFLGRLRQWKQVRTWVWLIREAESFWYLDAIELRRIGALELSQLLEEIPFSQRRRVNRWLKKYSMATRSNKRTQQGN